MTALCLARLLPVSMTSERSGPGFRSICRSRSITVAGAPNVATVAEATTRGAADAKQMASLLLLGFGGAFVIGGGVLLALDLGDDGPSHGETAGETARATTPTATLRVPCGQEFCGVLAQGRF